MYKTLVAVLLVGLLVSSIHAEEEPNYCYDKESWIEWDAEIKKDPGDTEFQMLHALRLGLCLKIARGDVTEDVATTIFEQARSTLIQKRKEQTLTPRPTPLL